MTLRIPYNRYHLRHTHHDYRNSMKDVNSLTDVNIEKILEPGTVFFLTNLVLVSANEMLVI